MKDGTIKSKLRGHKSTPGNNSAGKVLLFKLFRHCSKAYIHATLGPNPKYYCLAMRCKINPDSIVYYDCWRGYNILKFII